MDEFCDITGASEAEAAEWLGRYNGDSKLAMEKYFQQSKEAEAAKLSHTLAEVGVAVTRGASAQSMKEALKAHYKGKDMTPRKCCTHAISPPQLRSPRHTSTS